MVYPQCTSASHQKKLLASKLDQFNCKTETNTPIKWRQLSLLKRPPKPLETKKHTKACLTFATTKVDFDFERLIPIATSVTHKK